MDINNLNILVLAYLGDNVYEYYIRKFLIEKNVPNVDALQTESIKYVSAKSQSRILDKLIDKNILTDEEIDITKRGRNAHSHQSKSTDIITYKKSTGLETLIGYLYLNNKNRLDEIMKEIII